MRNLRKRYTYKQRLEFQETLSALRPYILHVLKERQDNACNKCKGVFEDSEYDIDHLLYNPMENIDCLQLLCVNCHKDKTDFRRFDMRK